MTKVIETSNTTHPGGQETTETINHYINEAHIVEIREIPTPFTAREVVLDNGTVIQTDMSVEEIVNPYRLHDLSAKDYAELGKVVHKGLLDGINQAMDYPWEDNE